MSRKSFNFRLLFEELDPLKLQKKFLQALLDLQHVERGSIWVRRPDCYECVEAVGCHSEKISGLRLDSRQSSIVGWVIENGVMTVAEPGRDERHYKEIEDSFDVKSTLILCFPLFGRNRDVYGAVQIIDTSAGGDRLNIDKHYLELLQELVDIGSIALSNSMAYNDQAVENLQLKRTIEAIRGENRVIGQNEKFLEVMRLAKEYAKTDFPVLITGESGTGKEVIAKEIHRMSTRRDRAFLVQNCSAIPDALLESELFGYMRGAFTGAIKDKAGLFEAADGGAVFLDEIGDMPMSLQARILRVIQDCEIKPLGATSSRRIDVRIISATNKDLEEAIAGQLFREDLYYRLNVLPLHLPPLRERREDIPLLLDHFIRKEAMAMGLPPRKISREALRRLMAYAWKGNIRELENLVKRILVIMDGDVIGVDDLPGRLPDATLPAPADSAPARRGSVEVDKDSSGHEALFGDYTWEELERAYVLHLLEKHRWNISRAAKATGVNRSTFDSRMKKLGIRKSTTAAD